MVKKTAAQASADAKAHLGTGEKTGEAGDKVTGGGVDKGGEFKRLDFTLDQAQRDAFFDARDDDRRNKTDGAGEQAFWRAAADRLKFNPITVEFDEDTFHETGQFTAYPLDTEPQVPTADLEQQHELAVDRMERQATEAVLSDRSLIADVRDFLLGQIKARPKPWSATSKDEQQDVAAACEHAARELIRKVVEAVAARERVSIRALLESYSEKDGLKAQLKIKTHSTEESLAAVIGLHQAVGKHVLITVASADDYQQERRDPELDEDQPEMPFEAGTDEHPEDDADLAGPQQRLNVEAGMVQTLITGGNPDNDADWEDEREATEAEIEGAREPTE